MSRRRAHPSWEREIAIVNSRIWFGTCIVRMAKCIILLNNVDVTSHNIIYVDGLHGHRCCCVCVSVCRSFIHNDNGDDDSQQCPIKLQCLLAHIICLTVHHTCLLRIIA